VQCGCPAARNVSAVLLRKTGHSDGLVLPTAFVELRRAHATLSTRSTSNSSDCSVTSRTRGRRGWLQAVKALTKEELMVGRHGGADRETGTWQPGSQLPELPHLWFCSMASCSMLPSSPTSRLNITSPPGLLHIGHAAIRMQELVGVRATPMYQGVVLPILPMWSQRLSAPIAPPVDGYSFSHCPSQLYS